MSEEDPSEKNDVVELNQKDIGLALKTPPDKDSPLKDPIQRMSSKVISRQSSKRSKELNQPSVRQSQFMKNVDTTSNLSKRPSMAMNKMGTNLSIGGGLLQKKLTNAMSGMGAGVGGAPGVSATMLKKELQVLKKELEKKIASAVQSSETCISPE